MPWPSNHLPKYRKHKGSGQAVVTLNGVEHYLGPHGTKASKTQYDRLIAEWLRCDRRLQPTGGDSISVVELCARYLRFATDYYRKDGRCTRVTPAIKACIKYLRDWYGRELAADFGPLALKAVRQRMVDDGLSRRYVNDHAARIKRMFKWAVGEQLVPPATYQALAVVPGLLRGRTEARETGPILPIDDSIVEVTLPHLPAVVADMVRLQRLTGMRPAEVCIVRPCDLDRSGDVWLYRPASHKTEHHGRERVVPVGPKAQAILLRYLARDAETYCFRPCDSEAKRRAEAHAARKTPLSCGNRPGSNRRRRPAHSPGDRYDTSAYRRAITRACDRAFPHPVLAAKYLVQHSAGSGKTNSIAWTAHFLADLHDAEHRKLFDSVLVVSDRNVIDTQLQEAIFDFERTTGVVATIKGEGGSKSGELATALSGDKKIVVCTIQTFPFALEKVRELAATEGKRFAVIADEAHSSQAGDTAAKLKAVLSAEELKELADGGEVSMDDVLTANMSARANDADITFVAFTATPKTKTMELFGSRPDPSQPAGPDNLPAPFHVYSMRQAIEEGFILDVLQNYTTYKLAFKLAHEGHEIDDTEVERSAAVKRLMSWVRLHPYNISQKVEIVVEHFREQVAPLLDGKAKAMVVVGSRQEAVRWQLAIDKYIKSKRYPLRTLVAFSGEVKDPESGPDAFTETSTTLNSNLRGRDIRKAFNTDEYQILLVANKFQTGFDQPLLCGMYVDKRLAGIQAVQTLSRLNRAYPGKEATYVLDFVNDAPDVLAAFKTYHATAALTNVTDPNLVYNLRAKLDATGHYDDFEVDRVVAVELKPGAKQSELAAAVEPVVDRLQRLYKAAQAALKAAIDKRDKPAEDAAKDELDALVMFQSDMASFVRLYTYLSQIFDYGNTAIEKRAIFFRQVLRLLEFGRERQGIDLSKVVLTHHTLRNRGKQPMSLTEGENPKLEPLTDVGGGALQEKEKALLNDIIRKVNDLFEGELTDQDKLVYVNNVIKGKLLESETLRQQASSNTKEQFANSPDLKSALMDAIIDALDAHATMSKQALDSEAVRSGLKDVLMGPAGLYEALREQTLAG